MVSGQRVQQVLQEGQAQQGRQPLEHYPKVQLAPRVLEHLVTLVRQVEAVNQPRVTKFMRIQ